MASNDSAIVSKHDAFISYSRKNEEFAAKLEQALEKYKPPKELKLPSRYLDVFRDKADFTAGEYHARLEKNLKESTNLIVICSPDARASDYVNDEIRRFAKLRGTDHIIPVLLRGIPNNEARANQEKEMAFPQALCDLMGMPLAVNYSGFDVADKINKGDFLDAWHMLLANIYDISRSEIEQREKKRRTRTRRLIYSTLSVSIAVLSVLLALTFLSRMQAVAARQDAEQQRNQAISAAEEAKRQKNAADQARDEEQKQRERAEGQTRIAEHQTEIAKKQTEIAEERRRQAEHERRNALAARDAESKALGSALEERGSSALSNGDVQRAMVYYAEAMKREDSAQRRSAAISSLQQVWKYRSGFTRGLSWGTLLQWSPDGRLIASCEDGDSRIHIWDTATSKQVRVLETGQVVDQISWAPSRSLLASSSFTDGAIRIWDAEIGKETHRLPLEKHSRTSVLWSPKGMQVAGWSDEGTVAIWNGLTGAEIGRQKIKPNTPNKSIGFLTFEIAAWSPDATKIGVLFDTTLEIFDGLSGSQIASIPNISSFAWKPDGSRLVTGHKGGEVVLRLSENAKSIQTITQHKDNVTAISWSPDGQRIVSISPNGDGVLWDGSKNTNAIPLRKDYWQQISWSYDGARFTFVSANNHIVLADGMDGHVIREVQDQPSSLSLGKQKTSAVWNPRENQFAAVGAEGRITIWNGDKGDVVATFDASTNNGVPVEWSPLGDRLASGSLNGALHIWERQSQINRASIAGKHGRVDLISWSSDAETLVTTLSSYPQQGVQLWSAKTSQPASKEVLLEEEPNGLTWRHSDNTILVAAPHHAWAMNPASGELLSHWTIQPFAVSSGKWPETWWLKTASDGSVAFIHEGKLARDLPPKGVAILSIDGSWSPDGSMIAVSDSEHLTIFSASGGRIIKQFDIPGGTKRVEWSPDQTMLAVVADSRDANKEARLLIIDYKTRSTLASWSLELNPVVTSLIWSSDSRRLVMGAYKNVWVFDRKGHLLLFETGNGDIDLIRWAPSNKYFAVRDQHETVSIRDGVSGKLLLSLQVGAPHLGIWSRVRGLAWSIDENLLAVAGADGSAKVFDVALSLEKPEHLRNLGTAATQMMISDGRVMLADELSQQASQKLARNDLSGGIADLQNAVSLNPANATNYALLGIAQRLDGDKRSAIASLTRAIDAQPTDRYLPLWLIAFGGKLPNLEEYLKGNPWTSAIARFYRDELSEKDLVKAATDDNPDDAVIVSRAFTLELVLGLNADLRGQQNTARNHYYKCVSSHMSALDALWCRTRLVQMKAFPRRLTD